MIGFLSVIIGIPVGFLFLLYLVVKADMRESAKAVKKDEDWLAGEMKKPKYRVEFLTDTTKRTSDCLPYNTLEGSEWNCQVPSEESAQLHLKRSFERGYFVDSESISYPVCNIKEARVVKGE